MSAEMQKLLWKSFWRESGLTSCPYESTAKILSMVYFVRVDPAP